MCCKGGCKADLAGYRGREFLWGVCGERLRDAFFVEGGLLCLLCLLCGLLCLLCGLLCLLRGGLCLLCGGLGLLQVFLKPLVFVKEGL